MSTSFQTTAFRHWINTDDDKIKRIIRLEQREILNPQHMALWRGYHNANSPYLKDSVLHAIWKAGKSWNRILKEKGLDEMAD